MEPVSYHDKARVVNRFIDDNLPPHLEKYKSRLKELTLDVFKNPRKGGSHFNLKIAIQLQITKEAAIINELFKYGKGAIDLILALKNPSKITPFRDFL